MAFTSVPIILTLSYSLCLANLGLANNTLTGSIPSQLSFLTDLGVSLDLSGNKLVGTIPTELGRLRKLSECSLEIFTLLETNKGTNTVVMAIGQNFDLGWNQLNGTIPTELGFLTNLELLFSLAYNNLSGPIPTTLGQLTALCKFMNFFRCVSTYNTNNLTQLVTHFQSKYVLASEQEHEWDDPF